MKIKKIGHCCLVIETNNRKILTDPGAYTIFGQEKEKDIDLILITHEHADHLHVESLKKILAENPKAIVVTNTAVGKIIDQHGIKFQKLEDGAKEEFSGISLEAHGDKHAFVRLGVEPVQNTGYFISQKFFYPGDALTIPNKIVEILALPVSGSWVKINEVLEYAKIVNPKMAFPVHDGMLNENGLSYTNKTLNTVLEPLGIKIKILDIGKEEEF